MSNKDFHEEIERSVAAEHRRLIHQIQMEMNAFGLEPIVGHWIKVEFGTLDMDSLDLEELFKVDVYVKKIAANFSNGMVRN